MQAKPRKRQVSTFVRPSVYDRIEVDAEARDTSMSEIIRAVLNERYGDSRALTSDALASSAQRGEHRASA